MRLCRPPGRYRIGSPSSSNGLVTLFNCGIRSPIPTWLLARHQREQPFQLSPVNSAFLNYPTAFVQPEICRELRPPF